MGVERERMITIFLVGASHQTGWTGLVADVIRRRHGGVTSLGDLLRALRDGKDLR